MSIFKGSDIVEFAIRIEENGENFYRYAVQLTKDEDTKKIFLNLAEAESQHKRTFEKIFAVMEKETPPETYDGEYAAYLHNYVDNNIIFKKDVIEAEMAKVKDVPAAIDFAIRRELDSILYYHEIKQFVPKSEHAVIDEVIEEERRHFKGLSNLRTRYTK
ncbi:MAG: ferritin family protein [Syntrophales bacterium]|nr:ferritin family protein [Syntrophales bacterium]